MQPTRIIWLFSALLSIAACTDRPSVWDQGVGQPATYGLDSAVALVDDVTHRATLLTAGADQTLSRQTLAVGHNVVNVQMSADKKTLFVLSSGDSPRRSSQDELPALTIIRHDAAGSPFVSQRYTLATPLSSLAIDPQGQWVAAYAGDATRVTFVQNPNEIVFFDLKALSPQDQPIDRTLRSFGGTPQRLTFSPELQLPSGPRRLLVVETDLDVSILDLDHLHDAAPRPEITVRLTNGDTVQSLDPAGVVIDDGDPASNADARIGVRLSNDTNVVTLTLGAIPPDASPPPPNDFVPVINLTDVGGIASDIAFVRTDGGIRLAALVPNAGKATLVDPETSITTDVALPASYQHLSLVTGEVGTPGNSDVALLYGSSNGTGGVAFWSLGQTSGTPYRSVETVSISGSVSNVLSVPAPNHNLKVLESNGNEFYVLNLLDKTASPLSTLGAASLVLSDDGQRVWAFAPGTGNLASVSLDTIHPVPVVLSRPITNVYDVARADGGRALLAVHDSGAFGVTVVDGLNPDTATSRVYSGLLLEGL
ncbi:MAG: hypothetical protein ABI332_10585 [Polyangiaceae bacterium]